MTQRRLAVNPALGFSSMYNVLGFSIQFKLFPFFVPNSRINLAVCLVTTASGFSMVTSGAKIFKDWHRVKRLDKLGTSQQELLDLRLSF